MACQHKILRFLTVPVIKLFGGIGFCPVIGLQFLQFHKFDLFAACGDRHLNVFSPESQPLLTNAARREHLLWRIFIFADKTQAMGDFFVEFMRFQHGARFNA